MIQRKHIKTKKTSFLKETVENADLHKVVLDKTMTTQEYCVYDFVAPLNSFVDLMKIYSENPCLKTVYIELIPSYVFDSDCTMLK